MFSDAVCHFVCRRPALRFSLLAAFWTLTTSVIVLASLILVTRYVIFPKIDDYNARIEQIVSSAINAEVRIGKIEPSWERVWPRLALKDVTLKKHATQTELHLPRVDASFYWQSLLGKPAFKSLDIIDAAVSIQQRTDTKFEVAGFEFDLEPSPDLVSDNTLLTLLSHQGRIDVTNATISLVDKRKEPAETIELKKLNVSFHPHLSHWNFGLQADLLGQPIDFRARLEKPLAGFSGNWKTWAWDFYTKLDAFNLTRTEPWLPNNPVQSGTANGEIWVSFRDGMLSSVSTDLLLEDIRAQVPGEPSPIAARRLEAQIKAHRRNQELNLDFHHLALETTTKRFVGPLSGSLMLTLTEDQTDTLAGELSLSRLNLNSLAQTLLETDLVTADVKDPIKRYAPRGTLRNVFFSWDGSYKTPKNWNFSADFSHLGLLAQKQTDRIGQPGFSGLTGAVRLNPRSGALTLKKASELSFPGLFESEDIPVQKLSGKVAWSTADASSPLTVKFSNLVFSNADIGFSASGDWKATDSVAGVIDVEGRIEHLLAASAWKYMPTTLSQGTRHWLEGALRGGIAQDGKFILRGALKDFPWNGFEKQKGHFLATAHLTKGLLDFAPPSDRPENGNWETGLIWPVVSEINADLKFEGSGMHILAQSATTLGAIGKNVLAVIPDMGAEETVLTIDARVQSELAAMSRYLEKSPVGAMLGHAFDGAVSKGNAALDLQLEIPLKGTKNTRVKGRLNFQENALDMQWPVPPLTAINGNLTFTESGARTDTLSATALGSPIDIRVGTNSKNNICIDASGKIDPKKLVFFTDTELVKTLFSRLDGETDFSVGIEIAPAKGVSVTASTDLVGVKSSFPAPLSKKGEEAWPSTFSFVPLTLKEKNGHLLRLTCSDKVDLILQLPGKNPAVTSLGAVGIGKKVGLPNSGLTLDIQTPKIHYRDWDTLVSELIAANKKDSAQSAPTSPMSLQSIRYETGEFVFDEIRLTDLKGRARWLGKETWNFSVASREADGILTWDFRRGHYGHIRAQFSRYHIPKTFEQKFIESAAIAENKTTRPSIELDITDLSYQDADIGSLSLSASTFSSERGVSWKIDRLNILNPDASLSANGEWAADGTTSLQAKLELVNAGSLLKRLGHEGILGKGAGSIDANLFWQGSPWNPATNTLQGTATVNMTRGLLEQTDLGVGGALLSLVSIQSLIKQLTFDFFDLSHTGFTFDSFTGDLSIADGVLTSDNLKLDGAKAAITLSGSADMSQSQLNARAVVIPKINVGAASLPLAIINPAIGLGAYFGQWLLSQPLNYLLTTEYSITGPLDAPVIEKILKKEATQTNESGTDSP